MPLQVTNQNRPKTVGSITVFQLGRVILPAAKIVLEESEPRQSTAPK